MARHAYNWGLWLTKNILNHNQHNPDSKIKFPTAIDLAFAFSSHGQT
ncbi:MAG: hypothetical protein QNJ74_09575 [Trichodesmium sp. MO_231.B1]|nr:hypothetical protein [Trichodesmium sp. MO_231.B1]